MREPQRTEIADRPKRPTLFGLEEERRAIIASFDETGEVTDEQYAALKRLDAALLAKVDGYCAVIKRLEDEERLIKDRASVLAAEAKFRHDQVERLKGMMVAYMENRGSRGERGELYSIALSARDTVVVDIPTKDLPREFQRIAEPEADKTALAQAIKAGRKIDGVRVIKGASFVVIK